MATEETVIKILDYAWVVIGALLGVVWKMLNSRIEAVEHHIEEIDSAHTSEMNRQRDNIAKLFDKLEEHGRRSEQRHVEILQALHTGLSQKADK